MDDNIIEPIGQIKQEDGRKLTEEEWDDIETRLMANPEVVAAIEASRKNPSQNIELDWRSL
jgi:hypothetical protein